MMKTTLAKPITNEERSWYIFDAKEHTLGDLAVKVADLLRGRDQVLYTPHIDTGAYIVVINAEKVVLTGKKEEQKNYMTYSGYRGGEKYLPVAAMREKRPEFIIHHAVEGMLPRNKLAHRMMPRLKVYRGAAHPHEAQNPTPVK